MKGRIDVGSRRRIMRRTADCADVARLKTKAGDQTMPQMKTTPRSFRTPGILRAVLVLNLVALLGCGGGGDSDSGGGCSGDGGSIAFVADQSVYDRCIQPTASGLCNIDLDIVLLFEKCNGDESDIQTNTLTESGTPCDTAPAAIDSAISELNADQLPTGGTYKIQDGSVLTCFGAENATPYDPSSFDLEGEQTVTVRFE